MDSTGPTRFCGSILKACQIWKTGRAMKRKSGEPVHLIRITAASVETSSIWLINRLEEVHSAVGERQEGGHQVLVFRRDQVICQGLCSGSEPQLKALLVQTFP